MIGIIGKKLGMTQMFNEQGQQMPCTVVEATPNPVTKVMTKETAGFAAVELGYGAQRVARDEQEGRAHAARDAARTKAEVGHAKKAGLEAPPPCCARSARRRAGQEPGSPDVQVGDTITVGIFAAGEKVKVDRHVEGPWLPGCREALRLPRRSEHARQHEAPQARIDRRRHGSVARHQGQEDARPVRQRAAHGNRHPHREDRRRAQPHLPARQRGGADQRHRPRAQAGLIARWLKHTDSRSAGVLGAGQAAARRARCRRRCSTARQRAGDAPGGEGVPRQPAPGHGRDEDARPGDRRQPEAVEAEGHGSRASGLHRAPNWPGGGTVFGPMPRSYNQIVPQAGARRWRARARSTRGRAKAPIMLVDTLDWSDSRSTKAMLALLAVARRRRTRRCCCSPTA